MPAVGRSRSSSGPETSAPVRTKGKVIPIDESWSHATGAEQAAFDFDWGDPDQPQITTEALYPAPEAGSAELARALSLLSVALRYMRDAATLLREGDRIGADLQTQRCQGLLPQLFACRGLGEGFAAVANASLSAWENLDGLPLQPQQIAAITLVLADLKERPFMSFAVAMTHMTALEDVGLTLEPPGYGIVSDWLDG